MLQAIPNVSVSEVADVVADRRAVAPVFLLSGIGAFLNVCASRLSRIVDRSREIEPLLLASRGKEHDRWVAELQDRRPPDAAGQLGHRHVGAVRAADLPGRRPAVRGDSVAQPHFGTLIALLFIASMLAIGTAFAVFLAETRLAERAVRVRSELLQHKVGPED